MIIKDILMFGIGIILLIKGADLFVSSGSKIGKTLKISEILIGLTLVSFGTSLPELLVAINASATGSSEIILGNILGTNLFNICVILGIVCIINPIKFLRDTVRKDMYMNLLGSVVLLILMLDTFLTNSNVNVIDRADGIVLLLFFAVFMYYTLYEFGGYFQRRKEENEEVHLKLKDIDSLTRNILFMILGILMVYLGSNWVVNSTIDIANFLNISETLIAILVIAVGTSLPEIFTTISAMKQEKQNIAIGNLIGSGMFNILFIIGIAAVTNPIILPSSSIIFDAILLVVISLALIIFAKSRGKYELSKQEGICLLSIYILYAIYVVIRK